MKLFLPVLLPLLFYQLVPSPVLADTCPDNCTCQVQDSIFCFSRKDTKMPSEVPTTVKNLYVFKNGIESLSQEDFVHLGSLEMLDLSQNQLTELPDHVFEPLSSLNNLDLSANQIVHISKYSFAGLELLERLYLYSNLIESIHPAAFDGLHELLELKLQGNKLKILPALKMPHLLLLDLRFNSIPSPGPNDLQTPKLESLKLGGLGLSTLNEELLGSFKNLHELDISNNQLTAFPVVLREAKGLVSLVLAGNPMGPLNWEDFEKLTELHELDISNLSLQGLPETLAQLLPHLKRLTVAENPFNCLCNLAWFPSWLRTKQIQLGRTEETRCHFPPLNSGKVLERLGHREFGCPITTTITTRMVKSTAVPPAPFTSVPSTTHAILPPKPSNNPSTDIDYDPAPPTPSTSIDPDLRSTFCPSNICLNGGTCWLDNEGHVECICVPGTSGTYCEKEEDPLLFPTEITSEPEIIAKKVTSSSIHLDLRRYIDMRPNIRGVKLTYRNLSGQDKRPKQLSVPHYYDEYILRGLQPNSTYSVCASPLGEAGNVNRVCTEAQTVSLQIPPTGARLEDPKLTTMLIPALAILLLLVLVAVAVGVACYMHKKKSKGHLDLECDPSQLELEGLDNGALPQKKEIIACPSTVQNGGLDYRVPLMEEHCTANNNMNSLKPSYF
ncbi:vasorin b precursor [Danio rerio]|uniref:LOC100004428 protein n=1 Tax=Danio rerio TaxID=7955 RepID=A4QNV9_DANRE|nr:vasorin b precursor [Danio rerio]AAI39542.1 LOC100004428 protein [Danio rerio]AAI71598.1 Vasorin like [Danio rerio]|eukprot:NP_001104232.1 vasorin precursor [Danio rerio]